jgi:2-polyprenyl-3-methyl-5-hydroxy-6-metoxy-1,4-benzoquinol methylase
MLQFNKLIDRSSKEEIEKRLSPHFYQYYGRITRKFFLKEHNINIPNAYSRTCKHIFDVTNAKGKTVLDIGCGYGLISIHLAIFGAKVVGIDSDKEKIDVLEKILRSVTSPIDGIKARFGDALELEFEEYFDVVICNNVISHVKNRDIFLLRVNRALKKRGVLYINDGNNKLDVLHRQERREIWKRKENRYRLQREKMIKEILPSVRAKNLDLLVDETAGLYGEEIHRAIDCYLEEGNIANKPIFKFRDPITGTYPEYEFNPFALKKTLGKYGFKAKILRPYLGRGHSSSIKRSAKKFVVQALRLFHPLSLFACPGFEILAEKL